MGRIPHRPGGPWTGILLAASVLGSCLQPAPAQTPVTIVLTPPSPAVGGGVSLAPQNPPQDFVLCSWFRSATTDPSSRILTYYPGTPPVQTNGSAHTGRETAGPGCALHMTGLRLNDTGSYTVDIQSRTSPRLATVHLPVSEKLSKPTVTPSETQVLENGTFTLTCNTSVSADTMLWLRNGVFLAPSDRLGLSPDNRTLTVLGVTRGDAGAYQCEVRNPVSTERSEPSTVTVAYGPDSARIDPPGPIDLTLGSPLTLSCVADSVPAPSYRWVLNGTNTNETGTSLTFNPTTLDHQGTYECQAHNPITNCTARASVAVWVTGTDPVAPRPGLSAGAVAGIVIGSLAGAALVGVGAYFLYSRCWNETPRETGAPVLVYENLPPKAGAGPVAQRGSPPDPSPTYQTLQPRQRDVYEELKK